jgi:hypothetical protein
MAKKITPIYFKKNIQLLHIFDNEIYYLNKFFYILDISNPYKIKELFESEKKLQEATKTFLLIQMD